MLSYRTGRRERWLFQTYFSEQLKLAVQGRIDRWIRACRKRQRQTSIMEWLEE